MSDSQDRITRDPAVRSGQPTIRGMRITVAEVRGLMLAGMCDDDILAEYPYLEREDLAAVRDAAPVIRPAIVRGARVTDERITFELDDGREISIPTSWSGRLSVGTPEQRANWMIVALGRGVHWPDVDEDIGVAGMLGVPESWLEPEIPRDKRPRN